MSFGNFKFRTSCTAWVALGMLATSGCTKAAKIVPAPAQDEAPAAFEIKEQKVEKRGAPVDILWVIDNSASMLTSQTKLKNGLATFAKNYLTKSGTDIQLAIITTDAFVANEAWKSYLETPNPETKKTPLQVHRQKEPNQRQWGPDYAKLPAGALMKTKGGSSGLVANFQSRVLVGTQGIYEEHGLDSIEQFLNDNERGAGATKLFRKGSQRIIVILSDENDQSMGKHVGPEPRKLLYSGSYYTGANAATADKILPSHMTISCPGDTNEKGKPITANTAMTLCVRPGVVEPVGEFKSRLDRFFRELDGNPNGNPNYLVTAIVGQDPATIEGLRRNTKEKNSETGLTVITNEIGARYLELVSLVGNGSFAMDIGASDYTPILRQIGLEIEKRSIQTKTVPQTTFELARKPDLQARFFVTVELASGQTIQLTSAQYHVAERKLVVTDEKIKSVLQPGDRIIVLYQPAEPLPASK